MLPRTNVASCSREEAQVALPDTPIAPNDYFKVRYFTSCGSQLGVNVIWYKLMTIEAGPTVGATVLGSAMSLAAAPLYKAIMAADSQYRGLGIQNWYTGIVGTTPSIEYLVSDGLGIGSGAIPTMSKQTCGIVTKRTTRAKKGGRGRVYLPFPSNGANTNNGVPIAAYITAATNWAAKLVSTFTVNCPGVNNVTVQCYHRVKQKVVVNPPVPGAFEWLFYPVLEYVVRNRWATQRRRGDYGKQNVFPI